MSEPEPVVLAIDVGTTNAKAGLVDLRGRLVASARATYALDVEPHAGRAEQDPEDWWRATVEAVRSLRAVEPRREIHAICVAGHGPSLAALDAEGRPTHPAITWLDTRAATEQAELGAATGLRGWALGVLPAALWLERNAPAAAARARWYLNTWEAVAFRLTDRAATSVVPSQPFPDTAALRATGPDPGRVAPTIAAGTVLEGLSGTAAAELGLAPGTPVVAGVVDAFASFHGAGLVGAGDAIDAGGTAGGFGVYVDRPVGAAGSFCTPAPLPGLYIVGGAMAATGKALDWLRDDILGSGRTTEELVAEAATVAPGADGLVFLPYLAGERSPLWDPQATGAFAGLTLSHGRAHMTRAILEAAALAIRHVAEPILAAGVDVREMRVCGGPARSAVWNRIKADVTGFPVAVPTVPETTVVGTAILAATGIGAFADVPAAIAAMTSIDHRLVPAPAAAHIYDARYDEYVRLHPAIASVLEGRGTREYGVADQPAAEVAADQPAADQPSAASAAELAAIARRC